MAARYPRRLVSSSGFCTSGPLASECTTMSILPQSLATCAGAGRKKVLVREAQGASAPRCQSCPPRALATRGGGGWLAGWLAARKQMARLRLLARLPLWSGRACGSSSRARAAAGPPRSDF